MVLDLTKVDIPKKAQVVALTSCVSKDRLLKLLQNEAFQNNDSLFPLEILMPCGHTVVISNPLVFPTKSVSCPCGNKDHWIIQYFLN